VTTSDGNTPQAKISRIIAQAAPAAKKQKQKQQLTQQPSIIHISGNGNVVAGRDVHIHHYYGAGARKPQKV